MKYASLYRAAIGLCFFWCTTSVHAQTLSTNTVKYKLTYNVDTEVYTVWVHPDYSTPNSNNTNGSEFSATAQVSLKVPKAFVIQDITDLKGFWEKDPRKLGDPAIEPTLASETYDSTARYYAIGKAPFQTNLGKFTVGDSVALFTFKGNGCFGPVSILAANDPFIQAAFNASSLNVRASFYSRSGQPTGGNEIPKEQFIAKKGPDVNCSAESKIGVAKYIASVVDNLDGSFNVSYGVKVVNTGDVPLANVQVYDTLSNTFSSPATYILVGGVTATPSFPVNTSFDGSGNNTGLLAGTSSLAVGDSVVLDFTVKVIPGTGNTGPFFNSAWGEGTFNDIKVLDRSNNGQQVDPDLDGNSGDNSIPTPVVLAPQGTADVALRVSVSDNLPQVNDNVTIRLVLENQGTLSATGLEVKDLLPNGVQFIGSSGDGSYVEGKWTVGSVTAGDSAVILLTIKVISMGAQYYTAEVSKMNESDVDSSPDNGVVSEDDFGRVCISAPVLLCTNQTVEISSPPGSTGIQWFRNGVLLPNETSATLKVTSAGSYTFTTSGDVCPAGGCCPILVEEVDCCPVNVCVPVVITKVKRGVR
ncbi:DUF11 domain-containing protein [Persicitalea jodogahamensis]|nr:DUF11 domain-containing protein [Persicitalea jodogahamensis]